MTLDLGFSAFTLPMPEHLRESAGVDKEFLQFTLVDCPGHASLIRTIIGGAKIIDMMILVIDVNKGMYIYTCMHMYIYMYLYIYIYICKIMIMMVKIRMIH
jgi:selenocysteine-specific elongation factor